ncbi:MAG: SIS domain-containing protein, partial [Bacteroidota bacterium]
RGGKAVVFGNGGSAAQASHFAGELVGRYQSTRRPYAALALGMDAGVTTCIGNDFGYDQLYARQVTALVKPGDWVLGLTTSGRSPNVRAGLAKATQIGAYTLALTGQAGLAEPIDALTEIRASSSATCTIQEVHLTLLHHWCRMLE